METVRVRRLFFDGKGCIIRTWQKRDEKRKAHSDLLPLDYHFDSRATTLYFHIMTPKKWGYVASLFCHARTPLETATTNGSAEGNPATGGE
jgi:hypothetical protein